MSETLAERARRRAAELGLPVAPAPEPEPAVLTVVHDDDLIPDIEPYARSEEDLTVDGILDGLDIIDAYNRWVGKGTVDAGGKRESIMVRCPVPGHEDRTPSAWINLDKQTFFCGACEQGGDKFDIAAWHFGFPVPGYKSGKTFPDLRRKIAGDMGYVVSRTPAGSEVVSAPTDDDAEPEPAGLAPVVSLPEPEPEDEVITGYIDWRAILPVGSSFLRQWMEQTCEMTVPDEFLFWHGIMAVNFAAGRDVIMQDETPVLPNLFVCLLGGSGTGKSRSIRPLKELLRAALPYDHSDPYSKGVMMVNGPSSAEALVDAFAKEIRDDDDKLVGYSHIRGFVQYGELSSFLGRTNRHGNILKPTLMDFYDGDDEIVIRSRGSGIARAEEAFAQAITTTQVKAVTDLLRDADADSGFLNRWVFATGTPKDREVMGGPPVNIRPLIAPLRTLRAWASSGRTIKLDADGYRVLNEWFKTAYEPLAANGTIDEEVLLQRCDLLMKKLIVTFCVDRQTDVATAAIVDQALALWTYLKEAYNVLRRRLGMIQSVETDETVLEALRAHEANGFKAPSASQLYGRYLKRKFKDRDLLLKSLSRLVAMGEIRELTVTHPVKKTITNHYQLAAGDDK